MTFECCRESGLEFHWFWAGVNPCKCGGWQFHPTTSKPTCPSAVIHYCLLNDGSSHCLCGQQFKQSGNVISAEPEEKVHHPKHYNTGVIEHCEMVEDQGHAAGYYFGQVTKYLFRAGQKPGESYFARQAKRDPEKHKESAKEDLAKAHWYLSRWLAWERHGKAIWKIVRRDPELVFQPEILAQEINKEQKS